MCMLYSCAFSKCVTFRLKPLDVAFMKAIHNKVNIVPVIAKADTLTLKERERLKKRVSAGHSCLLSMTWSQLPGKQEKGRLT